MSTPKESIGTRGCNKLTSEQRKRLYEYAMKTINSKPKRIKARRMWQDNSVSDESDLFACRKKSKACYYEPATKIAILDVSDEEALIEQVAAALFSEATCHSADVFRDSNLVKEYKDVYRKRARTVLESLGIIRKRRASK